MFSIHTRNVGTELLNGIKIHCVSRAAEKLWRLSPEGHLAMHSGDSKVGRRFREGSLPRVRGGVCIQGLRVFLQMAKNDIIHIQERIALVF